MTNDRLKTSSEIARNLIVSFALIIGGIWGVSKFIIFTKPSIISSHRCQHVKQNDGRTLVRLYVEMLNKGTATKTFKPDEILLVEINDLNPSKEEVEERKDGLVDFSSNNISGKEGIFKKLEFAKRKLTVPITPESKLAWDFNFIIPKNVKAISIYSYVFNEKLNKLVGKFHSSIYHLE